MERQNKKNLMMVLLLFAVLSPVSGANAQSGEISAQDMQRHAAVRETFDDNCAACHGYDGVPMLPGTPNFVAGERLERSDDELLATIAQGQDLMPPWADEFTVEQRKQLLNYIRGFAGELVFQSKCSSCHEDSVPASTIPDQREAVLEYAGEIDFCSSDIEAGMSRKDVADVMDFLVSLKR